MNQNPYAAPHAPAPMAPMPPQPGQFGPPQPWEIGEVLGIAWEAFKRDWSVLVFSPLIAGAIVGVPFAILITILGAVMAAAQSAGADAETAQMMMMVPYMLSLPVVFIIMMFFQVGLIRIFLSSARGQTPNFGMLFGGASRFFPLLGTAFLGGMAVMIGYVFLIVPGIILALGLMFAQYYCIDANMGVMDSLKASWAATNGQKLKLFLWLIVMELLLFAGQLACGLGVFVALPVVMVGFGIIYLRLSGQATAPAALPAPGGYGAPAYGAPGAGYGAPPGGGYGAPPGGGGYGPPPGGGGGYGPPPGGGAPGGGGGYGPPPGGGYNPGGGGGYNPGGGQPGGGGGYNPGGGQPGGGGGYNPGGGQPGGGGGYNPGGGQPGGGGGYNPGGGQPGGGGGYNPGGGQPGGGGGYNPGGGGGYGPGGGQGGGGMPPGGGYGR